MKILRLASALLAVTSLGAAVVGCDSEPETPIPRGAAKFTTGGSFKETDGTTKLCQFAGTWKMGEPSAGSSGTLANNEGAIIQCTVKPAGSGFAFEFRIDGRDGVANRAVELSGSGTLGADGKATVGAHFTIDAIPYYTSDKFKCTVSAAPTADAPWLQVAGGRIAAAISCERLDANDNSGACALTNGYIAFENCAQ